MADQATNENQAQEPEVVAGQGASEPIADEAAADKLFGETAGGVQAQQRQRELGLPVRESKPDEGVSDTQKAEQEKKAAEEKATADAKAEADKKADDEKAAGEKAIADKKAAEEAVADNALKTAEERSKQRHAEEERAEDRRQAEEKRKADAKAAQDREAEAAAVTPEQLRAFSHQVLSNIVVGKAENGAEIKGSDQFPRLEAEIGPESMNMLLALTNSIAYAHALQVASQVEGIQKRLDDRELDDKHESFIRSMESGAWAKAIKGYETKKPEELAHLHLRDIQARDDFWEFVDAQSQYIQDGVRKYADPAAIHEVLTAFERKVGLVKDASSGNGGGSKESDVLVEEAKKRKKAEDDLHAQTARSHGSDSPSRGGREELSAEDAEKEFREAAKEARKAL